MHFTEHTRLSEIYFYANRSMERDPSAEDVASFLKVYILCPC
jgi:hypothetical protein